MVQNEIAERLRHASARLSKWGDPAWNTCFEAAAEIDRLEAENARLREAIESLVRWQDAVDVCAPELGGLLTAMYRARALTQPGGE